MLDTLRQPWPWYVAGPLFGLALPALLILGNRVLGVSPALRHLCAALLPGRAAFLRYDWRREGTWMFALVLGLMIGGLIAGVWLEGSGPVAISPRTTADLTALGVADFSGLVPGDIFSWAGLLTPRGVIAMALGGFLVGFGAAYAGGCTSGHGISGLANLQLPSLIAVMAFFAGGLLMTHVLLPVLFQ